MENSMHLRIHGNEESFYISGYDNNGKYYEEPIAFSNNNLGYVLCRFLDLDTSEVINLISKYFAINHNIRTEAMINDGAHISLCELSEVFKIYPIDELSRMVHDQFCDNLSLESFSARIHAYIDFFDEKQIQYDSDFFSHLCDYDFFGCDIDIRHSTACSEYHGYFMPDFDGPVKFYDMAALYDSYTKGAPILNPDVPREYDIDDGNWFLRIALITLQELIYRNRIVRKCSNCGRHFVTENRIDTLYCDNPSPQNSDVSCKQYATQRLWYDRQQADELTRMSRNILSAKGMLAKRNPDIPAYQRSYECFRRKRLKWMEDVKSGKATREEYREWLLRMKEQKTIKETSDGND